MGDRFAVVVHLFYLDNWSLFKRKLLLLPKNKFDLYITMPKENLQFADTIRMDFPKATIVIVKNRGRDVLPFIITAQKLYRNGYKTVLKFHSKKSVHREDGQEWLESMLDQIIPEDGDRLDEILSIIKEDNFGLLGPASVYYPLTVNFPANGVHMTKILRRLYGRKVAQNELQTNRKEYGFFGGTMFWINISKISNLINLPFLRFEKEAGQIDGTLAHALERLFCLVPEISGSNIYEADGKTVRQRDYRSENIPEWSEDHDK